jgi:flagellar protein FliS
VLTASPQQLVVLLYQRLHRDLTEAKVAIEKDELYTANRALQHAQDIIVELHASLDRTAWEHAKELSSLYVYFLGELAEANLQKDTKRIDAVATLVGELRDAWAAAANQVTANAEVSPTGSTVS